MRHNFLFIFLSVLAHMRILVDAQDQTGFISIDCGLPANSSYVDTTTTLNYISDEAFINSGIIKNVAPSFSTMRRQLLNLRSFPEGERNCYNVSITKYTKYLIRTSFLYGNYDGLNKLPVFDLHLGPNKWVTIKIPDASDTVNKEIIHIPALDYIQVCLINTGSGTPFVSGLELRPLKSTIYHVPQSGALAKFSRSDYGSLADEVVRYPDDIFDRIWKANNFREWTSISTLETIDADSPIDYEPASVAMRTANIPKNASAHLGFTIDSEDTSVQYYVFLHFAELVKLEQTQSRNFNVFVNGELYDTDGPVIPDYLYTTTVRIQVPFDGETPTIWLIKTINSTLPPLLNAAEIYSLVNLSQLQTDQDDVDAITKVKSTYRITQNWQGDPCAPQAYVWHGLSCSNNTSGLPVITSLNLSSSGLTGEIVSHIANLKSLESLDLSNNNLSGSVPNFLTKLTSLKTLNLTGNKLTGSIPDDLKERSNNGLLLLSVGGNPNLCASSSCSSESKKKKKSMTVPIVASILGVIVLIAAVSTFSYYLLKRRKQKVAEKNYEGKSTYNEYEALESKGRHFTYAEVVSMTNNFQKVLGKGGSGTVYHGYLDDNQVAVKMLSPSSAQGYKEFQAEVSLLLRVHHRNLTSLVGFFEEGTKMGLIYEFMANGDIEKFISGSNRNVFKWERRLQVVVEAAQGLEYLHNGCKPPIVHRDIKTSNILLNDKFQAKLADFGLSRSFPLDGESYISTVVAGTPGYLDPEYSTTNWLTEKSDVYSFGIVLLKMVTGRPVIANVDGRNTHICQWVKSLLENGDIRNVVDPSLGGDFEMNSVWKAVEIAMMCTSQTSVGRPTMHQVVTELNECLAEEIARKKNLQSSEYSVGSMEMITDTSPLAR